MGQKKYAFRVWWGNLKETYFLKEIRVGGNVKLKLMLNKFEGRRMVLYQASSV
jgi:hypothetical protein